FLCARRRQPGDRRGGNIEDVELMPSLQQIVGHGPAHVAEPEKTDMHGRFPYSCKRWDLLLEVDGGIDRSADLIFIEPALDDGLGLRIELHHLLAVRAQIAELRAARAGEGEHGDR